MKQKGISPKKLKLFKLICLIGYIFCAVTLIIESCMDGNSSSKQSNTVGGAIAGIVNDLGGDQTIVIEPKSLKITEKIDSAYVNDIFTLKTKIEPEKATYKEIDFSSSNENIATINNNGEIKFLNEGEVTFEAINSNYKNIKDSMTVTVKNRKVQSISSYISNAKSENGIYTLEISKDYSISTTYEPSNATITEKLNYTLDNNDFLSINSNGKITPLKHSFNKLTNIKITYGNISTNIKVIVKSLNVVDLIEYRVDDIINIYPNETKKINISYYPDNSTYYNYILSSLDTSIVKTKDDQISGIKPGTTYITIKSKYYEDILKTIQINVMDYADIVDFSISLNDTSSFYLDETRQIIITSSPKYCDLKSIVFSDNENILSINENGVITPIESGSTIIKASANGITKTIAINILALNEVTDFTALINGSDETYISIGDTKKIAISYPLHTKKDSHITYISSDESIAIIDNNGNVTALSQGNVTITIDINGVLRYISLKIVNDVSIRNHVSYVRFMLNNLISLNGIEYVKHDLSTNNIIDLTTVFNIEYFDGNENKMIDILESEKTLNYSVQSNENISLSNNTLTIFKSGIYDVTVKHNYTNTTCSFKIFCYYDFSLNTIEDTYSLSIGESLFLKVKDNDATSLQEYKILSSNQNIIIYNNGKDDFGYWNFKITSNGVVDNELIMVIPVLNDIEYLELKKIINISFSYKYVDSINIIAHNNDNNYDIDISDKSFSMTRNQSISLLPSSKNDLSIIKSFSYISSDDNIMQITNNGKLIPKKTGNVRIILKENYSECTDYVDITIYNKIELDSKNSFTITGEKVSYIEEKNTYVLTNGISAKIKMNFTEDSTFKDTTYVSSNEKIITVGKDGTITPKKVGKTILKLIIDDGFSTRIEYEINIEIKRQDLITDLNKFFFKVRKALGHFGSFLIFGIFSTFTYLLFFKKKQWFYSIPINFIQGYGLAVLTEFIQTFMNGRTGCMSDILIDFIGFLVSSLTITIIFIILLIKERKIKNKN